MNPHKLYNELIKLTEYYLGPAAKRFIDRQTINHLNKKPGELSYEDFIMLADWIKLTIALLTKDEKVKTEYAQKLDKLVKTNVTT